MFQKNNLTPAQMVGGRRMKPKHKQVFEGESSSSAMIVDQQQQQKHMQPSQAPSSSDEEKTEGQRRKEQLELERTLFEGSPARTARIRHDEDSKKQMNLLNRQIPYLQIGVPQRQPWPMFVQKKYHKGKGDPMTKGQRPHARGQHVTHEPHAVILG